MSRKAVLSPSLPESMFYTEDFSSFSGEVYPDYVNNGRWGDCIYRWNFTRTLPNNGDQQFWVSDGTDSGNGPISQALIAEGYGQPPFLHDNTNASTLKLRTYKISDSDAATYLWGYKYPSGCLVDCAPPMSTSGIQYATWTIRFRINAFGQGQHIAFWLLPDDGTWPPEIDILEIINGQKTWNTSVHYPDGYSGPGLLTYDRPSSPDGWYDVQFTLTPDNLVWITNGVVVRSDPNVLAPLSKVWSILATVEVGTSWTGPPDATTPWPLEIELDRIYASRG